MHGIKYQTNVKDLNIKLVCYSTKELKFDMGYIVVHGCLWHKFI